MSSFVGFIFIHFISLSFTINHLAKLPQPLMGMIQEYTNDFESMLLGRNKYHSKIMLLSKQIRNKASDIDRRAKDVSSCNRDARQIVLRKIVKSINSSIQLNDNVCVKLYNTSNLRMSPEHTHLFWQWFVLYGSNQVIYENSIKFFQYNSVNNAIWITSGGGVCLLPYIHCVKNKNIYHIKILPSIMDVKNIYKVFSEGNDGFTYITIDTRKHDNNGKLISNNIITNIDFNKLKFSPKSDVIICGYNIEYKSNNIFPKVSISGRMEIYFVPPTNKNVRFNLKNLRFISYYNRWHDHIEYREQSLIFGEIGSRFMQIMTRNITITLPLINTIYNPYRYSVLIIGKPCNTCSIWPSCDINIDPATVSLTLFSQRFPSVFKYPYRGPVMEFLDEINHLFDRTCCY